MAKKSAGQTPAMPEKRPMPNGGMLYNGGVPGNKGGGRPADRVRAAMLKDLEESVKLLRDIADDVTARPADRIKALEVMAKYGMPLQIEGGENPNAPFLTDAARREALKRLLKA